VNEYAGLLLRTPGATLLFDPAHIFPTVEIPVPDAVLISHSSSDHFEAKVVHRVAGRNTKIIGTAKVLTALRDSKWGFEEDSFVVFSPGKEARVGGATILGLRARHPQEYFLSPDQVLVIISEEARGTKEIPLSFLVKTGDRAFYHAVDSLPTPEMSGIAHTGVYAAFVPLRMDRWNSATEAVEIVDRVMPKIVLTHGYSKLRGFLEKRETRRQRETFEKEMLRRGVKTIFLEKNAAYTL
jgi:L-ascorbate metabolism protein UlaG (beta-lactamase superfamily)